MFGFKMGMGIESLRIVSAVNCFNSFAASVYKIFLMYIMPYAIMDCNPLVLVSVAYRNLLGTD